MLKYLPILICLSLGLTSCGSDDDDNHRVIIEEEVFEARNFSTRIDNNLLVAGTRCEGGETTEYDGETHECNEGEWLVILDQQNVCTDDGVCTEIYVYPVVANLQTSSGPDENFHYSIIEPISPVSESQQEVIDKVFIRTDFEGKTEAVRR